jgi:hypothetical protein
MRDNTKHFRSTDEVRDVDFFRAKFNVSSRDVEKAIQHVGNSRQKVIEYLKKAFRDTKRVS